MLTALLGLLSALPFVLMHTCNHLTDMAPKSIWLESAVLGIVSLLIVIFTICIIVVMIQIFLSIIIVVLIIDFVNVTAMVIIGMHCMAAC